MAAKYLEEGSALDPAQRRVTRDGVPVVLSVNAQIPDGRDTSWLWDVDYRVLRGRRVFVTGGTGSSASATSFSPRRSKSICRGS